MARLLPALLMFVAGVVLGYYGLRDFGVDEPAVRARISEAEPNPELGRAPEAQTTVTAQAADPGPRYRTLHEILQIRGDFGQSAALYEMVAAADRDELELLLAESQTLAQLSEHLTATSVLYGRYAELDGQGAVDHALVHGGMQTSRWLQAIFHSWSRLDLDAALQRARMLDPADRASAIQSVLYARDDMPDEQRLEIAAEFGMDDTLRQLQMREDLTRSGSNLGQVWASSLGIEDRDERMDRLRSVAAYWARQDPIVALEHAASLDSQTRSAIEQVIMQVWARSRPRAAIEWMLANDRATGGNGALHAAFGSLAKTDRAAAVALLDQVQANDARVSVVSSIMANWAREDLRGAVGWFDTLGQRERKGAIGTVVDQYARSHPQEAWAWATSLRGNERMDAVTGAIGVLADIDAAQAAASLREIDDHNTFKSAAHRLANQWGVSDPEAAVAWAMQQKAGMRVELTTAVYQSWVRSDPEGALRSIRSIRSSELRDDTIVRVVRQVGHRDSEMAAELVDDISDEGRRETATRNLYRVLLRTDAAEAERFRAAHGLVRQQD